MTDQGNIGQIIRDDDGRLPAYAWPGGYAVAYVVDDGELLCSKCANGDDGSEAHLAVGKGELADLADGWRIDGYVTADWHDIGEGDWICAHCNAVIDPESD